ncbi:hypothetical protein ABZZ80_38150, partial [Streptomyces sp. NPDC006356]
MHEDRRQYATAEPLFRWHTENQDVLLDRVPLATVGVLWSQECAGLYGRDDARTRVTMPRERVLGALRRARVPYRLVHADD